MATNERQVEVTPERQAVTAAVEYFEEVKLLIPISSDSFKVEHRKKAHKAVDKLYGCLNELAGVTAGVRHELKRRESELDVLKAKLTEMQVELAESKKCAMEKTSATANRENKNGSASANNKLSYAAAMRKPVYTILIEPKNGDKDSESTSDIVKKTLNPAIDNLSVECLRKVKNGGVIVKCDNRDDIKKIETTLATKTDLQGREIKKGRPRMMIQNIDADIQDEDILGMIYERNNYIRERFETGEDFKKTCTIRTTFRDKKHSENKSAIVEVEPKTRNVLLEAKLKLGWQTINTRDYVSVLQCFRCYEIGHRAADCKKRAVCGFCAETGHEAKQCKAKIKCCALCKANNTTPGKPTHKTGHDSRAAECPTMRSVKLAIVNSIDYHGQQ